MVSSTRMRLDLVASALETVATAAAGLSQPERAAHIFGAAARVPGRRRQPGGLPRRLPLRPAQSPTMWARAGVAGDRDHDRHGPGWHCRTSACTALGTDPSIWVLLREAPWLPFHLCARSTRDHPAMATLPGWGRFSHRHGLPEHGRQGLSPTMMISTWASVRPRRRRWRSVPSTG